MTPDLNEGPCHFCLRAMSWFSSDAKCLPVCRYCLFYTLEVLRWAPAYGQRLIDAANEHAERRGDDTRVAA